MDRKRQKLSPVKNDVQKECQDEKITALERKLEHMENKLKLVSAELQQVKEERARDKINFETEKCEWQSKIDKYKEQYSELPSENVKRQSENEKLQSQNEKLKSENEKLQSENEKLQKYLQDLVSANINVEEKNQITLTHNTDLNSQITKIMNNRYPQIPDINSPPDIPRNFPYGPTPMPTSNPLYPSGVDFAPNMSASPYPSTAFTSVNPSNSSYPTASSSYLLEPNNTYSLFSSSYPASFNNPYPASTSHSSASSDSPYPASTSAFPTSSNSFYPTSCNSPHPAPTSAYPSCSNRHYPASVSSYFATSYAGPASTNQSPGPSPYPSVGSRAYDSEFRPSVNESNDDALDIDSLPDEIFLKVFGYLKQNQLGQIARVCKRWNVLTKCPVLWKKVIVKFFSCHSSQTAAVESFINRLPSCVTSIRLNFAKYRNQIVRLKYEKLCVKLQEKCPHLDELMLTNSEISECLPTVIVLCSHFVQNLKNLVFHHCIFSGFPQKEVFCGTSKIELLDLSWCRFGDWFFGPKFSKMPDLKVLCLYHADVDDTWIPEDTFFLNQLHVLNVGCTDLSSLTTFEKIKNNGLNLKELYLCDLMLRDFHLTVNNSSFPHLKTICLSCSSVTCEGVVSLIQSCPSLENVYVDEDVAESFAAHPFVVANRCISRIVKAIGRHHNPDVDYSHN